MPWQHFLKNASDIKSVTVSGALEEVIGIYFLSRSGCGVLHGREGRHTLEDNTNKGGNKEERKKKTQGTKLH